MLYPGRLHILKRCSRSQSRLIAPVFLSDETRRLKGFLFELQITECFFSESVDRTFRMRHLACLVSNLAGPQTVKVSDEAHNCCETRPAAGESMTGRDIETESWRPER